MEAYGSKHRKVPDPVCLIVVLYSSSELQPLYSTLSTLEVLQRGLLRSTPMAFIPILFATASVVPCPQKGSITVLSLSPSGAVLAACLARAHATMAASSPMARFHVIMPR